MNSLEMNNPSFKSSKVALIGARIRSLGPLFMITVLIPTLCTTVYEGVIASDIYVSESRFVVKNPSRPVSSGLMAQFMQSNAGGSSDGYAVIDYAESRDALRELNDNKFIENAYGRQGDWASRYHASWNNTFESLWKYYDRSVLKIKIDEDTSIITLKTYAYQAADSCLINERLLEMSERLVNKMNDRATHDAEDLALKEVARAEAVAKQANMALAEYRNSNLVFDPDRQSSMQLQQVIQMKGQLLTAQSHLQQLQAVAPKSAQLPALRDNVALLERQIQAANGSIMGDGSSLSKKAMDYTSVQLDATYAANQLSSAMAMLEQARLQAQKKQIYLERLVQPNLPDQATEPRRLKVIITTLIAGLLAWATLSMLLASIKEHKD